VGYRVSIHGWRVVEGKVEFGKVRVNAAKTSNLWRVRNLFIADNRQSTEPQKASSISRVINAFDILKVCYTTIDLGSNATERRQHRRSDMVFNEGFIKSVESAGDFAWNNFPLHHAYTKTNKKRAEDQFGKDTHGDLSGIMALDLSGVDETTEGKKYSMESSRARVFLALLMRSKSSRCLIWPLIRTLWHGRR
jgi:hypothetical protein